MQALVENISEALLQHGRMATAAVVLAVLWTLESWFPIHGGRRHRFSHALANLFLAGLNAAVIFAFSFWILQATEAARIHRLGILNVFDLSVWVHGLAAILLFDCWQYVWHRLNHSIPILWRFHAVHHADAEMDVTSGVRFHPGEILISLLARMAVLPLIGMHIHELMIYEFLSLPVILFHHSNLRISDGLDRAMRWILVTPHMHVVHHSHLQRETDSNYSSFLSVWDRLFGSLRLRRDPAEIKLGLDGWPAAQWRNPVNMLQAPFRMHRLTLQEDSQDPNPSQSPEQG